MIVQGSWKMSLRNSFKNFRRDHTNIISPSSKKRDSSHLDGTSNSKKGKSDITSQEYHDSVKQLCSEWKKGRKKRSRVVVKELMEYTAGFRRKWIVEENPMISQVIKNFPPLMESKMVRIHY